jgi:hypothetical protein
MLIPVDLQGAMRRSLMGASADDPTIPYSPSRSGRLAAAVRSLAKRRGGSTRPSRAGATATTESR